MESEARRAHFRWMLQPSGASAPHSSRRFRIPSAKLLIGRDTRESGMWIERELAHGARTAGATVHSIGVAPTPAVAYLTGSLDFDAGVVISASHNPYQDNGIKVFSGAGVKYGGDFEERIETLVADRSWQVSAGDARRRSAGRSSAQVPASMRGPCFRTPESWDASASPSIAPTAR